MGRHQQAGTTRRAHLSLGAAAFAGLACSAAYAFTAPVPTAAPAAVVSPVVAPVVATAAPVHTAAASATRAKATTTQATTSKATTTKAATRVSTSCDLSGPPVFGDPAHPDEITNRDCGYADAQGRERSRDPWIDGQLSGVGR